MKALLRDRKTWVEIDTANLFSNQYNTTAGKRIFDADIAAIEDDARRGMGKCRYCGALVRAGEEEKHYQERESKPCAGCFYYRDTVVNTESRTETQTETREDGKRYSVKTITTVETYEKQCAYTRDKWQKDGRAVCSYKECRRYGIEWFTPENTFFLKYPHGFDDFTDVDLLKARGFEFNRYSGECSGTYRVKIGSYRLDVSFVLRDGVKVLNYFAIQNARRFICFRIVDDEIYFDNYGFGWVRCATLDGVPARVVAEVKKICKT